MDGSFEVNPPSGGPNVTVVPILLNHCKVMIDAKTGDLWSIEKKGQP
jgi:hypothetical protein